MEEFVVEMQNNIGIQPKTSKRTNRFRTLFNKVVLSSPEIKILDKCDEEGDIVFEVPMRSVGIDFETSVRYKDEISSEFTANFIGELLVRENIDKFAKVITSLKEDYLCRVNKYIHRKFGMSIHKDKFILRFHASLVQSILTENFKKTMN